MRRACIAVIAGVAISLCYAALNFSHSSADSVAPFHVFESNADHIVVDLVVNSFALDQRSGMNTSFAAVTINGFGRMDVPGQPQLPVKTALLGIPQDAQVSLHILSDDSTRKTIAAPIVPAPRGTVQRSLDPNALPVWSGEAVQADQSVYGSNKLFPDTPVSLSSVGSLRSQRYATIAFAPLQIN